MDKETKDVVKPLIECLCDISTKQSLILELLSAKLPELSDADRSKLLESANANTQSVKIMRQSLAKI